jgi:hypothetical protein
VDVVFVEKDEEVDSDEKEEFAMLFLAASASDDDINEVEELEELEINSRKIQIIVSCNYY